MARTITMTKQGEQVSFDTEPAAVFSSLRNGRYIITIAKEKEPRSLDQNALMWLWFACIESETGTPRQDVHDYYCKRFLRRTIMWNGTPEVIVEGTRKLNKDSMSVFLKEVQADAATEFGIRLPDPEDRFFEDFYNTYK
jgi:hypothetical protein